MAMVSGVEEMKPEMCRTKWLQNCYQFAILDVFFDNDFRNIGEANTVQAGIPCAEHIIAYKLADRLKLQVFTLLSETPPINLSMGW